MSRIKDEVTGDFTIPERMQAQVVPLRLKPDYGIGKDRKQ
jgi:hypothetical protein